MGRPENWDRGNWCHRRYLQMQLRWPSCSLPRIGLHTVVAADICSLHLCRSDRHRGLSQRTRPLLFQNRPQTCRLHENLPKGFSVYGLPDAHHRRMRTRYAIERVHQEPKSRTRVDSHFPDEIPLPAVPHCGQR